MTTTGQNRPVTTADELASDADYVQLCRLVTEHAWRTDNGRSDTLYELWAEDGELDLGSTLLRGRHAIAVWGRQLVENPPWNTIHHVCSNMRFVTDGPDAAAGSTMLIVFMDADGTKSSVPFNVGEDHDRFVRTGDGWRFVSRRWVELYKRGDTINIP
ncbi:MAG: nuclear transport factor 2 family protein [Frankiaceae bacterium]